MNWEVFLGLMLVFGAMLLVLQRTERKRRGFVLVIVVIGAEVVRRTIVYRAWELEGWWALGVALLFNALFWVIIGRSNPPRSSEEEIEVLGNE